MTAPPTTPPFTCSKLVPGLLTSNDLMIINKSGLTIRLAVENLRVMGRATQGVRLINIKDNDSIAAVAKVMHEENKEETDIENGIEIENNDSNSNNNQE